MKQGGKTFTRARLLSGAAFGVGAAWASTIAGGFPGRALAHVGDLGHGGHPDALTHRMYDRFAPFRDWCSSQGVKGYLGEYMWPNDLQRNFGDEAKWNQFGWSFTAWLEASGMWASFWAADETQLWGGFWLTPYVGKSTTNYAISVPKAQAPVLEGHLTGPRAGFNASSAEEYEDGFSQSNLGTYGKDYWYTGEAVDPETGMDTFEYMRSRGYEHVRIPFRWERIQPSLFGSLNTTELGRLKRCVEKAGAAGLKVIIDVHNYAGYYLSSRPASNGAGDYKIGSSQLPVTHFTDLWRRLSRQFASNPHVIAYDLMNEPHVWGGIPSAGFASPEKAWESHSQKALNAIRKTGDTKLVMVPTYANADKVPSRHPKAWITDSANNHMYTAHLYFSRNGGGDYYYSYDSDNAYWESQGY